MAEAARDHQHDHQQNTQHDAGTEHQQAAQAGGGASHKKHRDPTGLDHKSDVMRPYLEYMQDATKELAAQFEPLGLHLRPEIILATAFQESSTSHPATERSFDNGLGIMQITPDKAGQLDAPIAKVLGWDNSKDIEYNVQHSKWKDARANIKAGAVEMLGKAKALTKMVPKVWAEMDEPHKWRAVMYAYNAGQGNAAKALRAGGPNGPMISTFHYKGKKISHDYTKELQEKLDYVEKHDPFAAGGASSGGDAGHDDHQQVTPPKTHPAEPKDHEQNGQGTTHVTQWKPAPSLADVRAGTASVQFGEEGEAVAWVQRALDVHPAEGKFGPTTKATVQRFQDVEGIHASGIVGPKTVHALDGWIAQHQKKAGTTQAPTKDAAAPVTGKAPEQHKAVQPEAHKDVTPDKVNSPATTSVGGGGSVAPLKTAGAAFHDGGKDHALGEGDKVLDAKGGIIPIFPASAEGVVAAAFYELHRGDKRSMAEIMSDTSHHKVERGAKAAIEGKGKHGGTNDDTAGHQSLGTYKDESDVGPIEAYLHAGGYGMHSGNPWCGSFATYCYRRAGIPIASLGWSINVPNVLAASSAGGDDGSYFRVTGSEHKGKHGKEYNGNFQKGNHSKKGQNYDEMPVASLLDLDIRPGDCFWQEHTAKTGHVGIIAGVEKKAHEITCVTIEGNSSDKIQTHIKKITLGAGGQITSGMKGWGRPGQLNSGKAPDTTSDQAWIDHAAGGVGAEGRDR